MCAACASDNAQASVASTLLLSSLVYHACVLKTWINLRSELIRLQQTKTAGTLFERTQWCGSYACDTGRDMVHLFLSLSSRRKALLKKQLMIEMNVTSEKSALKVLQETIEYYERQLHVYEKKFNMLLYLARAAGYKNNPYELLTSDYLITYDFEVMLHDTYKKNTDASFIARSLTIRPRWYRTIGISIPSFYTWSYAIASECIWYTLKKYSCLKALQVIFECAVMPQKKVTTVNINIKNKRR